MADEEDIDQLAAEAVQAMRRYVTAEIAREFPPPNEEEEGGRPRGDPA
jgi:hypothetical protein